MRCRQCGAQNQPGLRVCSHCGAYLAEGRRSSMRCRACGSRARRGLYLCPACGEPLRPSWRLEAAAAVALLLLAAASYYAVRRYGSAQAARSEVTQAVATLQPTAARLVAQLSPTLMPPAPRAAAPSATWTAGPSSTPIPTPTAIPPTATPIPPTPTALPSPTPTSTPLPPTATPTSVPPTSTPATRPTETQAPATTAPTPRPPTQTPAPTATPTPALAWPAPKLVAPAHGQRRGDRETQVWLSWEPVGPLRDDEWYSVSLRYYANGAMHYTGSWEKEPRWMVPSNLYQKYDPARPGFQWDVTVVRQTATRPDGGRDNVPASPPSETHMFYWE